MVKTVSTPYVADARDATRCPIRPEKRRRDHLSVRRLALNSPLSGCKNAISLRVLCYVVRVHMEAASLMRKVRTFQWLARIA
jgi:hypothetical protein